MEGMTNPTDPACGKEKQCFENLFLQDDVEEEAKHFHASEGCCFWVASDAAAVAEEEEQFVITLG